MSPVSMPIWSTTASTRERDERALAQRVRGGDQVAFEQIMALYYEPLCAFVDSYMGSSRMAEDCVQDVFFWLWQHRATLELRQSLGTYLYTAARNRALNEQRHERMVDRRQSMAFVDLRIAGVGQPPPPVADAVAQRDFARALWTAVSRLPPRRREVVVLRWAHDRTYAEIAQITGTALKTVESNIRKALKTLRREIAPLL